MCNVLFANLKGRGPHIYGDITKTGYREVRHEALSGFIRFRVRTNVDGVIKLQVTEPYTLRKYNNFIEDIN
jgi:hypothetical protein